MSSGWSSHWPRPHGPPARARRRLSQPDSCCPTMRDQQQGWMASHRPEDHPVGLESAHAAPPLPVWIQQWHVPSQGTKPQQLPWPMGAPLALSQPSGGKSQTRNSQTRTNYKPTASWAEGNVGVAKPCEPLDALPAGISSRSTKQTCPSQQDPSCWY